MGQGEAREVRGEAHGQQRQGEAEALPHDQSAARQGVAQGHQPDDAEPVADERRGRHPQGGAVAELGHDQAEQGLVVVDVGDRPAGDQRQAEPGLRVEARGHGGIGGWQATPRKGHGRVHVRVGRSEPHGAAAGCGGRVRRMGAAEGCDTG